MARLRTGVEYDGERVDAMLRRLSANVSEGSIAAYLGTAAHSHFRRRARMRFAQEGDSAVGKWRPLRESTKRIKEALGYGNRKINVRTGHLRQSLINETPYVTSFGPLGLGFDFPRNWDRPDLYWRNLQASGQVREHLGDTARPVVGVDLATDVGFLMASLRQWVLKGVPADMEGEWA